MLLHLFIWTETASHRSFKDGGGQLESRGAGRNEAYSNTRKIARLIQGVIEQISGSQLELEPLMPNII